MFSDSKADVFSKLQPSELFKTLKQPDLLKLRGKFLNARGNKMNSQELHDAIYECSQIWVEEDKFGTIFLQIDSSRVGVVTWYDFISHLLVSLRNEGVGEEVKSLHPPIRRRTTLLGSNHLSPIIQIRFNPQVSSKRTFDYSSGEYVTLSADGYINTWSVNFDLHKSFRAKSPTLKLSNSEITCCVTLPDISIIGVASTERDLRFYDVSDWGFQLRLRVTFMKFMVTAMEYKFFEDISEDSRLFLGDQGGNLHILFFSPVLRGPFRSSMETPVYTYRFNDLMKKSGFRHVCFENLLAGWIKQIEYCNASKAIAASSSLTSERSSFVLLVHKNVDDSIYHFNQQKGVWCFAVAEEKGLFATGGVECLVKVWRLVNTKRPYFLLSGHKSGITGIIFQDGGSTLCSISEDKWIKVWDTKSRVCVQSFLLDKEIGDNIGVCMTYNPDSRQIIFGGMKIQALSLNPLPKESDGDTHTDSVSVLLYNPLFKVVVSCGLDSIIMVWDPWTGRRLMARQNAHTRSLHGETINVEITAGCFDPGLHFLLTGAHDGTVKVWNFHTGTCVRNMNIEAHCEITGVFWLEDKILAMGWDKCVTEFATDEKLVGRDGVAKRTWRQIHKYEILCSAANIPHILVTATYNGELVFWNLDSSHPYRQYQVTQPTKTLRIDYATEGKFGFYQKDDSDKLCVQKLLSQKGIKIKSKSSSRTNFEVKSQNLKPAPSAVRVLAVRAALFLKNRPVQVGIGSLLVAVENGEIQVWSAHPRGGFIESFLVVHTIGDYVSSMTTDQENEFLFVGTIEGYIKTFLLIDYFSETSTKVSLPLYRLKFPFMWDSLFVPRAKRALRNQAKPVLLNSYRAHRVIITKLVYVPENELLISASADFSVRLWTLGGKYLGTLGMCKKWMPVPSEGPVGKDFPHTIPPDIKGVASSSTLRVLMGEDFPGRVTKKQKLADDAKDLDLLSRRDAPGNRIKGPILGNNFKLHPSRFATYDHRLSKDVNTVVAYQKSLMPDTKDVKMPEIFLTKKKVIFK